MHQACLSGRPTIVEFLLEKGAPINLINKKGETALHYAARANQKEVVNILIQAGADPTLAGDSGTPSEVAAGYGYTTLSTFLKKLKKPEFKLIPGPFSFPVLEMPQRNLLLLNRTVSSPSDLTVSLTRKNSDKCIKRHTFKITTVHRPTWCEYCQGFIWGLSRQAFVCECNYTVHGRCKKESLMKTVCRTKSNKKNERGYFSNSHSSSSLNSSLESKAEALENRSSVNDISRTGESDICELDIEIFDAPLEESIAELSNYTSLCEQFEGIRKIK